MNCLAHQYLSGDSEDLKIGNFIADGVKGKVLFTFPQGIQQGIKLHRAIDHFTDHHPIVEKSKNRLRIKYRKYAGVVVDLYYDHYLANLWKDYSSVKLEKYTEETYKLMFKNYFMLPGKMKGILPFMAQGNWLLNYGKVEGVQRALTGLARRTTFKSNMEFAHEDLVTYYDEFKNEFQAFFPNLINFTKDYIEKQRL